jgi:hypothetical protein
MISFRFISVIVSSVSWASGAAAPEAAALVNRAGKTVELFWEQLGAVSCTETLTQTKLNQEGKTIAQRKSVFDYLILMQLAGDELTVDESRLQQGKPPKAGDRALLTTTGFSTLMLIVHPHFQSSYEYSLETDQMQDGKSMRRLRFVHIRGHRSPSVLQLRGREYPIEWEGSAWIDPATGRIARVIAALHSPMKDVGLKTLGADVRYSAVTIKGVQSWLPDTATVEAATERQLWRNVHQFSQYKQFAVSIDTKTDAPRR